MTITNDSRRWRLADPRYEGFAHRGEDETQPRLLQPVANDTDVTLANGFTPANLRTGDILVVANSSQAVETTKTQIFMRNVANDGWLVFKLDGGNE